MLGLGQPEAMASIGASCDTVFKHAHLRKTFKGVAEIVSQKEEEKMQIE